VVGRGADSVIALALDAADGGALQRLLAAGRLPNLARLRARGQRVEIAPEWPGIATEPWNSFVRAEGLAAHGVFHVKLWDAAAMRPVELYRLVKPPVPFWGPLHRQERGVAVIDVPYGPPAARSEAVAALEGWQGHDASDRKPAAWGIAVPGPARSWLGPEPYGLVADRNLFGLERRCREATAKVAEVAVRILRAHRPDLLLLVFGAVHRAGHYLFAPEGLARAGLITAATAERLTGALDGIWEVVDAAVGRILEAAGERATVVLFALHGMGPESPWTDRLAMLLDLIGGDRAPQGAGGWLKRLRRSRTALRLQTRLPQGLRQSLGALAWRRLYDWSRTRIFAAPSEGIGALRLNLRGRERAGIVAPGREARAVLEDTATALLGLRELASDLPLVETIRPVWGVADEHPAPTLPDLVIQWRALPWWICEGVRTADGRILRFADIPAPPSGRTGSHRPGGFALVAGPIEGKRLPSTLSLFELTRWLRRWAGDATARERTPPEPKH